MVDKAGGLSSEEGWDATRDSRCIADLIVGCLKKIEGRRSWVLGAVGKGQKGMLEVQVEDVMTMTVVREAQLYSLPTQPIMHPSALTDRHVAVWVYAVLVKRA